MILSSFLVLLPVLFVLALGYVAGKRKNFDADQIAGINELVITYALPALLFVATVKTTRSEMLGEAAFLFAMTLAFVGLYAAVLLLSLFVLRHPIGVAGIQALLVTFPSVAFFGIPIFRGLFGPTSLLPIATSAVLGDLTLIPLTVIALEIHTKRQAGGEASTAAKLAWDGFVSTLQQPMVWAPLLGAALVLLDIPMPKEIDAMLDLIGSTTGGAAIFLTGLIIASYTLRLNAEIIGNVIGKMLLQPALMFGLVTLLGVTNPLAMQGVLLTAIPATPVAALLAARYSVYEADAASTVVLNALCMIVTYPLIIYLVGA